jgi:predicted aspartyl protease
LTAGWQKIFLPGDPTRRAANCPGCGRLSRYNHGQSLHLTIRLGRGDNMEPQLMGKVLVAATLENLDDLFSARKGLLAPEQVRRVEVTDALIDTGATGLLLPSRLIAELGLEPLHSRPSRTIAGPVPLQVYRAVRLTVQGRDCISDVAEISDDFSVIIGQVPLELMDWVVDPRGQRLIGNPEHGGQHMIEV